jgi:hypothetical protein
VGKFRVNAASRGRKLALALIPLERSEPIRRRVYSNEGTSQDGVEPRDLIHFTP